MDIWSTSTNVNETNLEYNWNNHKSQDIVVNIDMDILEKESQQRKDNSSLWNEIHDFAEHTSLHGVRNVMKPTNNIFRR